MSSWFNKKQEINKNKSGSLINSKQCTTKQIKKRTTKKTHIQHLCNLQMQAKRKGIKFGRRSK